MATLNDNIRQRREQLRYSQENVAHDLHISQSAYCLKEKGTKNFTEEQLAELPAILKTTAEGLRSGNFVQTALPVFIPHTVSNEASEQLMFPLAKCIMDLYRDKLESERKERELNKIIRLLKGTIASHLRHITNLEKLIPFLRLKPSRRRAA